MAQHDMVIDNAPGLAVRSDMNAAFQALASSSSGPIEPTIKYPGQLWLDTSVGANGTLRQRNLGNTSWTTLTVSGLASSDDMVASVFRGPTSSALLCTTDADGAVRLRPNGEASAAGEVLAQVGQLTVASGVVTSGAVPSMVLAAGSGGAVRLRPNGQGSNSGEFVVLNNGNVSATGTATIGGDVVSSVFRGPTSSAVLSTTDAGAVHIRPNGAASGSGSVVVQSAATTVNSGVVTAGSTSMVVAATSGGAVRLRPNGYGSASGEAILLTSGQFQVTQSAPLKPGGGPWADSSDERIKTITGDYQGGLAQIRALRPVVYTFKGNDTPNEPGFDPAFPDNEIDSEGQTVPYETSPHYQAAVDGQVFTGLIAQQVEQVMSAMVSKRSGYIDGEPVDDIRDLDTSNLIYAFINAFREIADRLEALEGGGQTP